VTPALDPDDTASCEFCGWECEPQELQPGPSGDKACSDCLSSWEGLPDNAGGFTFAYAA
jgi:hypothetical protein